MTEPSFIADNDLFVSFVCVCNFKVLNEVNGIENCF